MNERLQGAASAFRDRVDRIAIYAPLFELRRKTKTDREGNPICWFSLGLLTLLFFFESMLTRNRETSFEHLGEFLRMQNANGPILEDREGFARIAKELIDAFRDPSGNRKSLTFYNWESQKEETLYFSLLEVRESDLRENRQYYQLTNRGLELVFATKEYFSEFQISINQLVLRKQLEKGEFNSALREIDEMRIAVEELRKKLVSLGNEIQRNIVSYETQERYSGLVEDITKRLEREQVEFQDLEMFVREAKKKYEYDQQGEKEQRSYQLIIRIFMELNQVHQLHRTLLNESITLKRKVLQAAKESLYHVGLSSFHFDQEIVSRVVASPLPPLAVRTLVRPMVLLERFKGWAPEALFQRQRMERQDEREEVSREFQEFATEEGDSYTFIQRHNFQRIAEVLQEYIGERRVTTLLEFMTWLELHPKWVVLLHHRSFYDFWLLLHQKSPLFPESDEAQANWLGAIITLLSPHEPIQVLELPSLISKSNRYTIQDMIFRIGGVSDDWSNVWSG